MDALWNRLKDKVTVVEAIWDTPWGTRKFTVADLDGNELGFSQNRELAFSGCPFFLGGAVFWGVRELGSVSGLHPDFFDYYKAAGALCAPAARSRARP